MHVSLNQTMKQKRILEKLYGLIHWLVPNSLTDCLNSDQDPVSQKSRMPKLVNKSLFMECTEH